MGTTIILNKVIDSISELSINIFLFTVNIICYQPHEWAEWIESGKFFNLLVKNLIVRQNRRNRVSFECLGQLDRNKCIRDQTFRRCIVAKRRVGIEGRKTG